MLALPTSAHIGLRAICLLVRDTLATNLLSEIGLCAILTGGRRHSRDLPFCLTLGPRHSRDLSFFLKLAFVPWTMTTTPAMYTGDDDNNDDDDTGNDDAKLAFVP